MEINIVQGRRRRMICSSSRQMSPERGNVHSKACVQAKIMKPTFKKVQVVYYLSRNGRLEHPHYMEVTHLAHQQLRLKDVIDRLSVLRGKGMPSLYSWSCKRSYKNGYVWNDLGENDVIYPSEGGAEYVLKGSELLLEGCSSEKLQHHLQIGSKAQGREPNVQPNRKSIASRRLIELGDVSNNQYFHYEEDGEEEEYEEKTRCSRGVSTDEIEEFKQNNTKNTPTELPLDCNSTSSPPSTTSSTVSEKTNNEVIIIANNNSDNKNSNNDKNYESCTRFEDGDPVGSEPLLSKNSMLLSLIACGGSGSFRKTVPPPPSPTPCIAVGRKSGCGAGDLHRGVVCRVAAKKVDNDDEEMMSMIGCMSENPRFGNPQAEEKEYFSGSIVEAITTTERTAEVEHGLKKSNSHNEERSTMSGLGEAAADVKEVKKEKAAVVKGKCLPRMIKPSSSKQAPKK